MPFCFDIETLGKDSNAICLSACLMSLPDGDFTYEELLNNNLFVKFNLKEQRDLGRKADKDTVEWWKTQNDHCKRVSLYPTESDSSAEDGLDLLREYFKNNSKGKNDTNWIRGNLDGIVVDSLAAMIGVKEYAPWWCYRDVRTAVDILKESSDGRGYCKIPGFDVTKVIKHDPIHECAYDAMMLKYGV